ncbi:hypothetical protein HDU81_008403 [Chytriomyces hyalinus]|nr:hypothetical protein HDU81_008403 [Chytriomyces hyalinus]
MTTIDMPDTPLLYDEEEEQQIQPGIAAVLEREICLGAPLFLAESSEVVRSEFVRKIYVIMAAQVGFIWVLSILFAESELVARLLLLHPWIVKALSAVGLVVSVLMHKLRGNEPSNGPFLLAYTVFEAHALCLAVLSFQNLEHNLHYTLVIAFYWFLFMALYTFQPKLRFHGGYPLLYGVVTMLTIVLVLARFFGMRVTGFTYIESIACVVSILVVYDKLMRFTPFDYVIAVADFATFVFPLVNLWVLVRGPWDFGKPSDEGAVVVDRVAVQALTEA